MPFSTPFQSILEAAGQGAEWAWSHLIESTDGSLRSYVRRQGAIDVDDLVGETWLHVARRLRHFSGDEAAFRSWVFMVAHHRLIDERRRTARRPTDYQQETDLDRVCPAVRSAESEVLERLGFNSLQEVLDRLPPDQREVVLLRFVSGFGVTEAARIVGKSPGAVRALQRRALRRLEKILRQSGTF